MKRAILSAAIVLSARLLPGCFACTQADCVSDMTVTVTSASGMFAPGAYQIVLSSETSAQTCSFTIQDMGQGPEMTEVQCAGAFLQEATVQFGLSIKGETIVIAVERDGTLVDQQSFDPLYISYAPNGEACGPVCESAWIKMTIP